MSAAAKQSASVCLDIVASFIDSLFLQCVSSMPTKFSALDVLAGMMMKGAAKCDKHAE